MSPSSWCAEAQSNLSSDRYSKLCIRWWKRSKKSALVCPSSSWTAASLAR